MNYEKLYFANFSAYQEIVSDLKESHKKTGSNDGFQENFELLIEITATLRHCSAKLNYTPPSRAVGTALDIVTELIYTNYKSFLDINDAILADIETRRAAEISEAIEEEIELKINNLSLENSSILRLTTPQKSQIQSKITSLRKVVKSDDSLSEEHRERLLDKVNIMQSELDKKTSDYFRIRGRIIDISEAAGEVAKNLKPYTERAKEIADLFKSAKSENLQIGKDEAPKQIENKSDEDEGE